MSRRELLLASASVPVSLAWAAVMIVTNQLRCPLVGWSQPPWAPVALKQGPTGAKNSG